MKLAATLAALALAAFTTGQAMAQAEKSCADIKKALTFDHAAVKGMRGAVMPPDLSTEDKWAAKIQIAGFSDCAIESTKTKSSYYWNHHLSCADVFADGQEDAALTLVEDLTRCLGDTFSEREQHQKLIGGRYRTNNLAGSVTTAGRDTPVRFGTTDYMTVRVEEENLMKLKVILHVYYSFKE